MKVSVSDFGGVGELRLVLESHIGVGNRSTSGLAIIGANLGSVYQLDRVWLAEHAAQLFDLDGLEADPPRSEGWAAWNAHVIWNPPHFEYYRLFETQYKYAVTQSALVSPTGESREDPMCHLGEHLLVLYARGQLSLDDPSGPVRLFIEAAHPAFRRHAIEFAGRFRSEDNIPKEVIGRLTVLWDTYWQGKGKSDAGEFASLPLFGSWFRSGIFPVEWALSRLDSYTETVPLPRPDYGLIEELSRVAENNLTVVLRIVERMVRGDREGWRIHAWNDDLERILQLALGAEGECADAGKRIIDYLARRGYTSYGDILRAR